MQRLTTGDEVLVIRGNDKGRRGKIRSIVAEKNAVIVEGVNIVKRHLKAMPQRPGGILEVEAPIDVSKLALINPATGKPTRVKYKVEGGKKTRVAKDGSAIAEARK